MKRKITAFVLILALLTVAVQAFAADSGADPLTWAELKTWAEGLVEMTKDTEPLNDPKADESKTEDGYAFQYDFGTLFFSQPERNGDDVLTGAVIYDDAIVCPRGTNTLTTLLELLEAYYNENPLLVGSYGEALLYVGGDLDSGLWNGMVQRDGQRVDTVVYTVHEPLENGGYTNAGLLYTLQQNTVVAIRAWGLNDVATAKTVEAGLQEAGRIASLNDYAMVPYSEDGAAVEPFDADDLFFAGIDFLNCTPENAVETLGEPDFDDKLEDGDGLRVMGWQECELVFAPDAGGAEYLRSFTILDDTIEGPRALRLGDSINLALQRFRFGEGELEGNTETLYDDPGTGAWATAEYGEDASAVVRYGLTLEDGRQVVIMLTFEMLELMDITVYLT